MRTIFSGYTGDRSKLSTNDKECLTPSADLWIDKPMTPGKATAIKNKSERINLRELLATTYPSATRLYEFAIESVKATGKYPVLSIVSTPSDNEDIDHDEEMFELDEPEINVTPAPKGNKVLKKPPSQKKGVGQSTPRTTLKTSIKTLQQSVGSKCGEHTALHCFRSRRKNGCLDTSYQGLAFISFQRFGIRCKSSKGLFFLRTTEKGILVPLDFNHHPEQYSLINTAYNNLYLNKKAETDCILLESVTDIKTLFDNYHVSEEIAGLDEDVEEFGNWKNMSCEGNEKIIPDPDNILSEFMDEDETLDSRRTATIYSSDEDRVVLAPERKKRTSKYTPTRTPIPINDPSVIDGSSQWHMDGDDVHAINTYIKYVRTDQPQDVIARQARKCLLVDKTLAQFNDCYLEGRDMSLLQGNKCLSSPVIEIFLHSIENRHTDMRKTLIIPDHFYPALSDFHAGYNFGEADRWSQRFPVDFLKNPMIFIINTSITGEHWLFTMIDPRNPDPEEHTLTLIDPYGKDRNQTPKRRKIISNLKKWYKMKIQEEISCMSPVDKPSKKLKVKEHQLKFKDWNHNLPNQHLEDSQNCGVICAMYAYYLLTMNRFPTRDDVQYGDEKCLRAFMARTIFDGPCSII
jgi:hypothetical protein